MSRWTTYTKAFVAALIPVAQLIQAALTDDKITANEWTKVAMAVVGAFAVYWLPNKPYVNTDVPPAGG